MIIPPIQLSKKQQARFESICKDGLPKKIRCYDNGGQSIDRYTIVFTGNYTSKTDGEHWYLSANAEPFNPAYGFGQHGSYDKQIDYPTYSHLGKKIKFEDLPEDVQKFTIQGYLYLWDFLDEDDNWIK